MIVLFILKLGPQLPQRAKKSRRATNHGGSRIHRAQGFRNSQAWPHRALQPPWDVISLGQLQHLNCHTQWKSSLDELCTSGVYACVPTDNPKATGLAEDVCPPALEGRHTNKTTAISIYINMCVSTISRPLLSCFLELSVYEWRSDEVVACR